MKKYPRIRLLGHEENKDIFKDPEDVVVIEEKYDGANFRFMISNGQVIFGSRNREINENDSSVKNFLGVIEYIKAKLNSVKKEVLDKYNGYVFFGENMVKHTLDYDWETIPRFIAYDIYDMRNEKFLDWKEAKRIFEELGFKFAKIISVAKAYELKALKFDDDFVPIAEYPPKANPNQKAEGIVFKNYNKQLFAKYVQNQFKEQNKIVFGASTKFTRDYAEFVVAKYCTNPRIEKTVFKLVDEGMKLEMSMMKRLPSEVYFDIWEEEMRAIIKQRKLLDLRKMYHLIIERCRAVLQQIIVNNRGG